MSEVFNWDMDCIDWMEEQFEALVDSVGILSPSQVAEKYRYLPAAATSMPGYFRYDVTPYWKEVVDCFSSQSPVREVAVMKGVQVGFTTAVFENVLLYVIMEMRSAPCMLLTSTIELAQHRLETNIVPMLMDSGLGDKIVSAEEGNTRKTGKTKKKLEWQGGGYALPFGATSAHKLSSIPVKVLLRDEPDRYPRRVGNDGDPMALSMSRTNTFEQTRKILDGSTPLIKGESVIEERFKDGDQRYYEVPCKKCGEFQKLVWQGIKRETNEVYGLIFKTENGRLVPRSVKYICKHCGHEHINADKSWMLPRGKWVPTAIPKHKNFRSYHLSALYSPAGAHSWEAVVMAWLDAWDVENNKPKNVQKLQVFYNNERGIPFEKRSDRLKFQMVSSHRRTSYRFGEIPNNYAVKYAESPILILLCTVDVQADELSTTVWGFTRGGRAFLVDYWQLKGDTSKLDDPGSWGALRTIIEGRKYKADDGKEYTIWVTLIDSGYQEKIVNSFCDKYAQGVFSIKGVGTDKQPEEFKERKTKLGATRFDINVDIYKDNMNLNLRHYWEEGVGDQPDNHFNAPMDTSDRQLKELTAEYSKIILDPKTNQTVGRKWYRSKGVRNELWDLYGYAIAALDIVAFGIYRAQTPKGEKPIVDWFDFWDRCEKESLFFS